MSYNVYKRRALDANRPLPHRNSAARSLAVIIASRYGVKRSDVIGEVNRRTSLDLQRGVTPSELPLVVSCLDSIRETGNGLPVPERHRPKSSIKSAMGGFLGTFISRYSSWNGYWLFGFLVPASAPLKWDLLHPPASSASCPDYAHGLAATKLHEQLTKAGVAQQVTRAELEITQGAAVTIQLQDGRTREGFVLTLTLSIENTQGRRFMRSVDLQVAPHNRWLESPSSRP